MEFITDYTLRSDGELRMFIDGIEYMQFENVESMHEAKLLVEEENLKLTINHFSESNKRYWAVRVVGLVAKFTNEKLITTEELMDKSVSMDDLLSLHDALKSLKSLTDMINVRNMAVDFVGNLTNPNLN